MRRGVSTVVATVVVVALTVLAAGIIGSFVIPFVKDGLTKSTSCQHIETFYRFDDTLGYNCYRGSEHFFSLQAGADKEQSARIQGFDLLLYSADGSTERVQARSGAITPGTITMKDGSPYAGLPGVGNTRTYASTRTTGHYEKASVFVVLTDGTICKQPGATMRFEVCT